MTFADLVKARRLEAIAPSRREIADLLDQAARSLEDARRAITGKLSPDWQFMIAYAAPLSLAAAVIRSEGYRTMGKGHHVTLFQALAIAIPQVGVAATSVRKLTVRRPQEHVTAGATVKFGTDVGGDLYDSHQ